MDIKLQLRYMQNFAEEISSTLKIGLDEPYRNKIKAIIDNTEITDVEKVRQMYILVQEGHGLISKTSNIDPIHMARANSIKVIVDAVTDSLMDRSTIKNVRDVINANNYEAVNVDASVTTNKGITQAGNFLDAVVSSVRPDHEMLKAVQEIESLCAHDPNLKKIIEYNFPNYDTRRFIYLSNLRQSEDQTLNVGISLANEINAEINKNHVDAICILSMLKRQSECKNGLLNDSQKELIKTTLSENLSDDQKVNVDKVHEGYNQWYKGVTIYLKQGYDSDKIERQRRNKTRLTGETLNELTYEAKLRRILDANEIGFANHFIAGHATAVESMLTSSAIYTKLNTALSYLSTAQTKLNPNDKTITTGDVILKDFIKNSILLNIMENSTDIQSDRKRNKEIIEALKFQMNEQIGRLHALGITSYYQKIGECVEEVTKNYFMENGLTPKDEKNNLRLYNDSVFNLAFRQVAKLSPSEAVQYSDVRALPEYKSFFKKFLKENNITEDKIDKRNWPIDISSAANVPVEQEVMPKEFGANFANRISAAKDLSGEALEINRFATGPTISPTGPTVSPTGPTGSPTGPTGSPTGPTVTPTGPTVSPTGPTVSPTGPTISPTGPTVTPTGPTGSPTGPTVTPTGPTVTPTGPTVSPTGPTVSPTGPTISPTGPTVSPTGPTVSPTGPTISPTGPTVSPTGPTISPTGPTVSRRSLKSEDLLLKIYFLMDAIAYAEKESSTPDDIKEIKIKTAATHLADVMHGYVHRVMEDTKGDESKIKEIEENTFKRYCNSRVNKTSMSYVNTGSGIAEVLDMKGKKYKSMNGDSDKFRINTKITVSTDRKGNTIYKTTFNQGGVKFDISNKTSAIEMIDNIRFDSRTANLSEGMIAMIKEGVIVEKSGRPLDLADPNIRSCIDRSYNASPEAGTNVP